MSGLRQSLRRAYATAVLAYAGGGFQHMMLRAQVHAAHDCWRFIVRSGAWSPFTAASSGLSPFTVRSGGCCHFTVRSGHQHPAPVPSPPCTLPAHSTSASTGTRHPAPSTSTRSPPRAQPAHSTSTSTDTWRHVRSQLTAPATCFERARTGSSLLFEV